MKTITVGVLGAGGTAGMNFCRCLRMSNIPYRVVGFDNNETHLRCNLYLNENSWIQSFESPDFEQGLMELCEKHEIDFLHAQPDEGVFALCAAFGRISPTSPLVFLPSLQHVTLCQDKLLTAVALKDLGVRSLGLDHAKMKDVFEALGQNVWVRCRYGAGSRAALPVRNRKELRGWLSYWEGRGIPRNKMIACEFLPGREYAFQSLWYNGDLVASAMRLRLEYAFGRQMPSGQSSTPSIAKSTQNEDVQSIAERAICKLTEGNPHGIFCVDLKEDASEVPRVTEVNAGRFFTTSDFFAIAGCNMPDMYVRLGMGLGDTFRWPLRHVVEPNLYWVRGMDREPTMFDEELNAIT